MKVEFILTSQDIVDGRPGSRRSCPWARCIARTLKLAISLQHPNAMPAAHDVDVTAETAEVVWPHFVTHKSSRGDTVITLRWVAIPLPDHVQQFIANFDYGDVGVEAAPLTFSYDMPERVEDPNGLSQ